MARTAPVGFPNVSASDVATPVLTRLQDHLAVFLGADAAGDLEEPREWFRLPSVDALSTAVTPAVAVVVDGLAAAPTWSQRTGYTATWDVLAAVYLRGSDYDETRSRCERYVAALRACLLSAPEGIARAWQWVDEHYDQVTQASSARTLAGGYLHLSVTVEGAAVPSLIGAAPATPGQFTTTATTARPARGSVADLQ